MAILANVETMFGEKRELYIRVNNVEVSNHGVKASALLRGFASKEAFDSKKHYMFEKTIEFNADVSGNLWEQAYSAFCEELNVENDQV